MNAGPQQSRTDRKALAVLVLMLLAVTARAEEPGLHFEETILPILEERCFSCHSHEAEKMKGGLTLDSKAGWTRGGDGGPAIVPGDPDKSLLIEAVRRTDDDLAMPPKKALPPGELKLLEDWVKAGAFDPRTDSDLPLAAEIPDADWWSWKPLAPAAPPKVKGISHPIDAFLAAKRSEAGLPPSPPADRRTLIRRLSFNLHGLPPTPEAVTRFEADEKPEAYQRLVAELLASPRYGERWARHWLDTVHFADSHGCEHDGERPYAWRYRDYVIGRLNSDISWPRFIREQLAADVFFPDESALTAALGFLGAGPLELSRKGTAPVTFLYLDRDDMVTQTLGAFASATVNCARCHDHKFDAIGREDYYALQAVFAGIEKDNVPYDPDQAVADRRKHWTNLLKAAQQGDAAVLTAPEAQTISEEWWTLQDTQPARWKTFAADTFVSSGGATLKRQDDGSILASGHTPETENYLVTGGSDLGSLSGIRVEVLPHDSLPTKGPGRAANGNLKLTELVCQVFEPGSKEAVPLPIESVSASWSQGGGWDISKTLDGDPKTSWGIHPRVGEGHHAVFVLKTPAALKPGSKVVVTLKQLFGGKHIIGRFRISLSDSPKTSLLAVPDESRSARAVPAAERTPAQQVALAAPIVKHRARTELSAMPAQALVYAVTTNKPPEPVHVLNRGDIDKPLDPAAPGALAAIPGLEGRFPLPAPENEAARRAALADWLASPDNPLTWRSIVNRVWHYHFGRGLCDTPNDLGRMGGAPSHPELLDWLAVWFRDEADGSLKQLHQLIVTSQAYQQQSLTRAEAIALDGDNRLLWRMNRLRLDAGQLRDAVRQVSGRLELEPMGGRAVKHFKTNKGVHNTKKLDYENYDWTQPAAQRRSIYRLVWRGMPDPFMEAMDFPNLGLLAPKRTETISPLQSLSLYNDPFMLVHSRFLAERLEKKEGPLTDHVREAVRLVHQREPGPEEQRELVAYAEAHGLPALCRVLLNSSEFLFLD